MDEIKVALSEVPAGSAKIYQSGNRIIALFHQSEEGQDKWYAIDERCSHRGAPLSEGTVQNGIVTCPWHFLKFELSTGSPSVRSYKTRVDGANLHIQVD
jgi:nitrite reductase/ring-hydroxylating ferredoxin subunit